MTQAEEIDQVVSQAVQNQSETIGHKAVTTETVGVKPILEFRNTVLTFAAVIVELADLGRGKIEVGDDAAHRQPIVRILNLDADASSTRPSPGLMPQTAVYTDGRAGGLISLPHRLLQRSCAPTQELMGFEANGVFHFVFFQQLVQIGNGKTGVGPQANAHPRKSFTQTG